MKETGMKSIDEGVSLTQLIPLYITYHIRYHCVDFKYHKTASHADHNYKANENYPVLFYMIANNHLYPIRETQQQNQYRTSTLDRNHFVSTKMHNHKNEQHIHLIIQMRF